MRVSLSRRLLASVAALPSSRSRRRRVWPASAPAAAQGRRGAGRRARAHRGSGTRLNRGAAREFVS
jgi:hypothetical protein